MQFVASRKQAFAPHRLLRIRHRYFMTRSNRLRLRYVATSILTCVLSAGLVINLANDGGRSAALEVASVEPAVGVHGGYESAHAKNVAAAQASGEVEVASALQTHIAGGVRRASAVIKKPVQPRFREVEVASGQTVAGLLQDAGLSGSEAYYAVKELEKHFDVRKVRSGQKVGLHFRPDESGSLQFAKMEMKINPIKQVAITRNGPQQYHSALEEKELVQRSYGRKAKIQTSLYGSAAQSGIPQQIIAEIIRIYSWDIDFQRDIRRGDKLEVLYETFETEDGEFARYGEILYANLSVGGKDIPIYRYEMKDGTTDFFQPNGMSIRKTLMKTPIDGARISSGFGMRHHPVLGYNKMHKGTDFAAPTGTPIYAAGHGTVEYAARKGGYGNYVRIRHNSKLKTAYAHLHKFKKGLHKGARVEQGEIIGYVGTTGRSTGPHLHYEVLVHNKQVNPRSVDLPTGEQLTGKELNRFESLRGAIYQQYVTLVDGVKMANAAAAMGDVDAEDGDTM